MRAWMMDRSGGDLDRLPNGVVVVIGSISHQDDRTLTFFHLNESAKELTDD